ncbi:hypothetical protein [Labedaea rhizosphaerae]|uniref:DUF308 domain-containing protein n=1 Tax=Labedaea rhizosphaerae TaxID=598644 RepID=A0A4R6S9D5_LABRH|nr:hypothetical protein [Labedaea rhizosphaerae]TDP96063.1 hypothetical protein EV186_10443 [Labedaea rhizosphaerae]
MKDRHGGPDGPEDVDAAFAEIIADLEREGFGSSLLDEPEEAGERAPAPEKKAKDEPAADAGPDTEQLPATRPATWRGTDTEWDWSWESDDEHYVPPDPPPLPRLRPVTILAIILLVLGLVLMVVPSLFGLVPRLGTPIALVAIGAGIVLLLLRIKNDPSRDRSGDDDNGAQI